MCVCVCCGARGVFLGIINDYVNLCVLFSHRKIEVYLIVGIDSKLLIIHKYFFCIFEVSVNKKEKVRLQDSHFTINIRELQLPSLNVKTFKNFH